jgi:copper homeostasis protein CutC
MNIRKNARLALARRIEMVRGIVERGLTPAEGAC